MKTTKEIKTEISNLETEINLLKIKHKELHSVDDCDEYEQSFLTLCVKNSRIDTLKWVLKN